MSKILDHKKVGVENDRRRKLSADDYDVIRHKYEVGNTSYQKLADEYGVSKKLILLICNEDAAERHKAYSKEHRAEYYSTEKRSEYMRNHRQHKRDLIKEGKI